MKKFIVSICIILLAFSLMSCKENGTTDNVIVDVGESTKFTKEEINKAVVCVKQNFEFPACTLTKIWYSEEKSNTFIEGYFVNGGSSENIIVLLSNFDVDDSGDNPVLNPNSTYTDYNWILIRDSKTSDWEVTDFGY